MNLAMMTNYSMAIIMEVTQTMILMTTKQDMKSLLLMLFIFLVHLIMIHHLVTQLYIYGLTKVLEKKY